MNSKLSFHVYKPLFYIIIVCWPYLTIAQRGDINFINLSIKNGLSSNTVHTIIKDRYGYMWFGTEDGLNKFDGVNFTVYRHKAGDSSSIGAGAVMTLQEDQSGNLWVGTGTTLSLYSRERDAFINYNFSRGLIRTLCIDHTGDIWVGTYIGLLVFDPKTKNVKTEFRAKPDKSDWLTSDGIISLFEDSRHRMWVGTVGGLYLYLKESNSFRRFLHSEKYLSSSNDDVIIRSITEDFNGNIWLGTNNDGLSVLQPESKTFKNYKHIPSDIASISSNRIYAIARDNTGMLWVGTEDGLNIFDPSSGKSLRINNNQREKFSFIGRSIRSIFVDKDGIYWVGTFQAGINRYDKNLAFFNLYQSNPFDPHGLSSSIVTSFIEGNNGIIYIGTDGGGLNTFNRTTGLFSRIQLGSGNLKGQSILALEKSGQEIWIGTYPDGVYVLDMKTGNKKHYVKGEGPQNISGNEIFCIKKDSRGKVWIGTNGNGLSVFDPATGNFDRYDPKNPGVSKKAFQMNGFIRSIEEDRFGNIWIGSHGSGIAIYDPWRDSFRMVNRFNSNLPQDIIYDIYKSTDGNIWVGTAGEGLCLYDYTTKKFTSYSEPQGLANSFIYKILEDGTGKLWVSTNKGISSFDRKESFFKNYSYHNGVQQSAFSRGAGLVTSDGEMYFGGLEGFNYFNPGQLQSHKNIPSLVFTDLKISNRSVTPGINGSPISKHISVAKEIRLSYKQNFSIDFVALNYTAPQESQYSYKLEGFDKDWNEVGSSKTAVYTNLAPGNYTFRLKAISDDGSWSTPETSIKIYVKPPFWRTVYAYIFYALLIGFILWGIRYRSIKKLKSSFALEQERQQFKLMLDQERKEAERKHEFDQIKIKFLTNLSHEFRTPISLILGPAEQLLQEEKNQAKQEKIGLIKRNARRLLNLVSQLLDFRKLEESELKLNLTDGDLVSFVKDVADSFKDISHRKHIDFHFSSSASYYYTSFDRDKIERILFNLLSNAFKFTKKDGKVELRIEHDFSSGIKIIVSDSGIGIMPEVKEKVFERFFQADIQNDVLNQGTGIGLSITKEFVSLHGGTIEVESEQGKGSRFIVQLPCVPLPQPDQEITTINTASGSTIAKNVKRAEAGKPTILLIDDHEDFLQYLSSNLQSYYKIVMATDGKQGWQKILSAHPQVIVSDINMPEMDGIMLCRKIRSDKRTSHIPIILLTALTGDANQIVGLNTGANDYLTKPFNFEVLHLKIKNLLNLNLSLKNIYGRQLQVVPSTLDIQPEDESEKLLINITSYIEANIDNPDLSVENLSKSLYMSRGSLYNKIVDLTGESPVEFIRSVRLNKAAALLKNSDMKISDVGYTVGFTSSNYFARAFKAKFSLTPTDYAKFHRKLK